MSEGVQWTPFQIIALLLGLAFGLHAKVLPAQPFERDVAPFPVLDEAGVRYAYPFLGGFNVPRPQLVDLDGDGDLDLFVQEQSGEVMFFENVGSPAQHRFVWRTDRYEDLDVGEWYRLADLDGDGDLDLLAEQPLSLVRYYRNDGTPEQPSFTLAADTLRGFYLDDRNAPRDTLLFIDRQNVPALADIDCDGWPDLLLATISTGTLIFYEHTGTDDTGVPRFRFVTDQYQDIQIIGNFGKTTRPGETQHGANSLIFVDLDRDGDLDLFWGDFFSPSLYYIKNLSIENTGTCAMPDLERTSDVFPIEYPLQTSGYNAPYFADIDGDGDLDLFIGVLGGAFSASRDLADNFYFYENEGAQQFTLRTTRFLSMIDLGDESIPALADLDGDGDLDLIVADKIDPSDPRAAKLVFFQNEGTPAGPSFNLIDDDYLNLNFGFNYAPDFADIDADGDLDLFIGAFDGSVAFYRNDGMTAAPDFVLAEAQYVKIERGSNSTPAFIDIDADGDLDLFVGEASGALNFYRNIGTRAAAAFVLETEAYGGINAGARSYPVFHDLDGDGDFDLFVGTERSGVVFYRNTGTPQQAVFMRDTTFALPFPNLPTPALADVDGDGDIDIISGGEGGGLVYYENRRVNTSTENPPLPSMLEVHGSYPNPFHTSTTLHFSLPEAAHLRLAIYDALGREVAVLIDRPMQAGAQHVPFEARHLPVGVYFYTLKVEERELQAGKMVLVR